MPQDLESAVSACYSPQQDEWQVTNLTQLVLDITPADGFTSSLQVSMYDPSSLANTAGELEVAAQNAVMDNQSPDNAADGEVLLPVGGTVIAAEDDLPLTVAVDTDFSNRSFEATSWTSYVVSNVPDESPDSYSQYSQAIADCVNDTYQLWQTLQQQPPPSVATLIYNSLQEVNSCNDLREKVKEYLESKNQQENLALEDQRAADHADEANWESDYMQEEQAHDEIKPDL